MSRALSLPWGRRAWRGRPSRSLPGAPYSAPPVRRRFEPDRAAHRKARAQWPPYRRPRRSVRAQGASIGRGLHRVLASRPWGDGAATQHGSPSTRPSPSIRPEGPWRDCAVDIGVVQRVKLRPQYIGLERQSRKGAPLLFDSAGVALNVVERELSVPRRLIKPAAEIGDHLLVDEAVIGQHTRDAALMERGGEEFRQAGGHRFRQRT